MKLRTALGSIALAAALGSAASLAFSDDDDHGTFGRTRDVAAVTNPRYAKECGSCHMAYPPGLLPARSWQKVMAGLADHFGDNAELDAATTASLTQYLVSNSSDNAPFRRSRRIDQSIPRTDAPLRITATPYFVRKHDEIPARMIKGNPKVGSLSQCNACHTRADQGSFSEREISIPGYGRWDD